MPLPPGHEPPDDPLLRRFLPDADCQAVPANAFRPTKNDTAGISVSFERFPNPIRRILTDVRRRPEEYAICRFGISGISGLSVAPDPNSHDEGHATIPEISPPYDELSKTDKRKIQIKEWQEELVRRSQIIHRPGDAIV